MPDKIKTLLIGESWFVQTTETKGADTFSYSYYDTGVKYLKAALSGEDFEFCHLPSHMVESDFPSTVEELLEYRAIIISDVGANTFLLPVETFLHCKPTPNKLQMLAEYVRHGGGLCMAGGYMSYMGIEGKGRWNDTPVEEVLPITFFPHDDRAEHPESLSVEIDTGRHEIFNGMPPLLNGILGYNRAVAKPCAEVAATIEGDPFIALGSFGKGRSIAFATDCAPHWCSIELCESPAYTQLWQNMVRWLARA